MDVSSAGSVARLDLGTAVGAALMRTVQDTIQQQGAETVRMIDAAAAVSGNPLHQGRFIDVRV